MGCAGTDWTGFGCTGAGERRECCVETAPTSRRQLDITLSRCTQTVEQKMKKKGLNPELL